jgi:hypothetical protein
MTSVKRSNDFCQCFSRTISHYFLTGLKNPESLPDTSITDFIKIFDVKYSNLILIKKIFQEERKEWSLINNFNPSIQFHRWGCIDDIWLKPSKTYTFTITKRFVISAKTI